jgi:structural maintenance of chromosome 4
LKQVQKEHEEARAELKKLVDEATVVMEEYKQQETILAKRIAELNSVNKEYEKLKKVVSQARSVELDIQHQLEDCASALVEWQEKTQNASKKYDDLNRKLQGLRLDEDEELEPLPIISAEALAKHTKDEVVRRIAELEEAVGKMKPNMNAIREFRKKDSEYQTKAKELEDVTQQRDTFRADYEGLRKKRLDEFMSGFSLITMKLKEMYQMITLGGDAELELVDSLDPFSEGILFSVRPPKKSWKNISNLSGGEKTLSSLALVFALHHYKPTPLYVMDEIDAALDFKNVSIVANYIKERTRNAQFIIISLRNYMFELADRLVGIYKTEDCTKSVTINPAKFATALRTATA